MLTLRSLLIALGASALATTSLSASAASPDALANALWVELPPAPIFNPQSRKENLKPTKKVAITMNKIGANVSVDYEDRGPNSIRLGLIENPALAAGALSSSEQMERTDVRHQSVFTHFKAAGKYDAILSYNSLDKKDKSLQIKVTDEQGTPRFAITLGITANSSANNDEVDQWVQQVAAALPYAQLLAAK